MRLQNYYFFFRYAKFYGILFGYLDILSYLCRLFRMNWLKKHIGLSLRLVCILLISMPVFAQDNGIWYVRPIPCTSRVAVSDTSRPVIQTRVPRKNWINRVLDKADGFFTKNIDPEYLALPRHRFRIAINGDWGSVFSSMQCSNVPYFDDVKISLGSNITPKLGFVVSYRNMNIGYSWDLFNGYSNLKFSMLQNGWGVELFRRKTNFAGGSFTSSGTGGKLDIGSSDMSSTTFFLSAYVSLNRRKFSMPAAFNASFIQKKSAGAPLLVAQFIYSRMGILSETLMTRTGGVNEMELYQIAVGVGYGYNYTPNKGKFLLHVSATPMLSVLNRMIITGDDRMFIPEEAGYNLILSRKIKPESPVYVTGQAKLALAYNITPRFVLAFNGVVNNIRFKASDRMIATGAGSTLTDNPEIKMRLMTWDWVAVLYFGVRFL